ncbi:hypothetical protein BC835DRAFT_1307128 [Cytidiella melzeri]|nr:hypothetical protein BC835DRAFT_1307128 [Cytidiella melzeri]
MKKIGIQFEKSAEPYAVSYSSVLRALEPGIGKINARAQASRTFSSRLGLQSQRSEWFRVHQVEVRIVTPFTKGVEVMDLTDFENVSIPQRDGFVGELRRNVAKLAGPWAIFCSNKNEFLLCYDGVFSAS